MSNEQISAESKRRALLVVYLLSALLAGFVGYEGTQEYAKVSEGIPLATSAAQNAYKAPAADRAAQMQAFAFLILTGAATGGMLEVALSLPSDEFDLPLPPSDPSA